MSSSGQRNLAQRNVEEATAAAGFKERTEAPSDAEKYAENRLLMARAFDRFVAKHPEIMAELAK